MNCEFCGKQIKTQQGLAKHLMSSTYCIQIRKQLENLAKQDDETKPKSRVSKQVGKRAGELEEVDSKLPAKRKMVLDSITMQHLATASGGDKGKLETLLQNKLQNLGQTHQDSMGWLPYRRALAREDDAMFDPNVDSSSEEDEEALVEEDTVEEDDYSDATGDDSDATGDEVDAIVTDDEANIVVGALTQEELFHRLSRRECTWKRFKEYVENYRYKFLNLTENEEKAIRIMRTLIRKRAPLDTYQEVMAWHLRESGELAWDTPVGQSSQFISREKLMKQLRKRYHMDHQYAIPVTLTLPHSKSKIVVWKKFAQNNVLSLLTDPRWTDEDWLYFGDDPFAKPPEDYPFIEDLNTGEAYQETYKRLITKPNQILVAVPLYIDGAVTGQFDKLQVTVLKMSVGILNRRARDKEHAWRSLGFVTNYTKEDSRGKRIFVESGHIAAHELYFDGISDDDEGYVGASAAEVDKAADYHAIIEVLLDSLKQLIADGMVVDIFHKGKLYKDCELVFFVPFVKCDGDEGDKLCCHYRSRGKDIKQLCRYCQCPSAETDNPKANYSYKTEPMMQKLFEKNNAQKLKELSQIGIKNAFHGLRFGLHNTRGIHGACPWELLHAILLGIFKYVRDCFFAQLGETSATAKEINALAQEIGARLQRQSDRNKPRTKFAKGILKGKLMAKEYSGVLLVMAALLQSKSGKAIITSARRKDFRKTGQISDWVLLVETLLQWESYLNLPQMEKKHVHRLKKKHQYLLYLLRRVGDRQKGMGFKVMKFHAVLHLALDILMFGVPMVVDTGSNESHHKTTKIAAKLTQKDVKTFEKQTSDRLDDFHVLDLALQDMNGCALRHYSQGYPQEVATHGMQHPTTTGGMIFKVFRDPDTQMESFQVVTRMKNRRAIAFEPQYLKYCLAMQEDLSELIEAIPICAEHRRKGQVFRAHPNYRGKGPWRDWVMIEWNVGEYPAQLWGFMDLSEIPAGTTVRLRNGTVVYKGVWAVIESCNYVKAGVDDRKSEIFTPIILDTLSHDANGTPNPLERKFYLVHVDTFVRPLVVIPNIGTQCEYLLMAPKDQWQEDFKAWIMAPHMMDEEEMRELPTKPATKAMGEDSSSEESSQSD